MNFLNLWFNGVWVLWLWNFVCVYCLACFCFGSCAELVACLCLLVGMVAFLFIFGLRYGFDFLFVLFRVRVAFGMCLWFV